MKTNTNPEATARLVRGARRAARATTVVLAAATLAGCEVTNPGPVQDEFLNEAAAHEGLVHGAASLLAQTVNGLLIVTGHMSREIFPSGQGGPGGVGPIMGAGHLDEGDSPKWGDAQAARWVAEDALDRFANPDNEAPSNVNHVQAYLWAGYANRVLGDNYCVAVYNGGAAESHIRSFERAETHFTNAIAMASGEQLTAAYAGRAQTRMWLEKWSDAASDAAKVPLDFVYALPGDEIGNPPIGTANAFYYGNSPPHRAQSIHHTWFYDYYLETGDARAAWTVDPEFPYATQLLSGYPGGQVPWSYSLKYTSLEDPFRLATGREMLLIRAEASLVAGDWPAAMTLMKENRTATSRPSPRLRDSGPESLVSHTTSLHAGGSALEPWSASSSEEAWTALKRERAIEMWLEGRRLGDQRRWGDHPALASGGNPSAIDWPDWESTTFNFRDNPPSPCIGVSQDELDLNPNL